ncbi:hypothetical protein [Blastopirellula retiformator]|uniref:Uncharacterized protein n=1 Tax=Blastopirellula retiformator TaxID=2527970 RepID=A0A5C5UY52_9BACT|nr:hypothetical protein [Blastopirellula retiformator]TWT30570.1 hypothetical protein Enr8_40910 [Blastopirellula retiformator]
MRIAAYITAALFVLTAVMIIVALVVGFSSGIVQIDGWEMTVAWNGSADVGAMGGDPVLHQHYFFVTTPIYVVAIVGIAPLAILAAIAAVLFGRSAKPADS